MTSIYNFKVEGIRGEEIDFAEFKGKIIMVVNVASECGFTPQYAQLQDLYNEFNNELVIIGFPSNDFGGQEPGTNNEIHTFCSRNFGVSFPLASKITILGEDKHPIYQWLTQKSLNGHSDSEVQWNFQKYLLDETGQLCAVFPSSVDPCSEEILNFFSGPTAS
ncbi:MAG: glutathione peroxidase [Bacteroidota bacterium]